MFAASSGSHAPRHHRRAPKPPPMHIARAVTIHHKPVHHAAPRHTYHAPVHHYNPPPVHHYNPPRHTYHAPVHHYNPPPRHTYHAPQHHYNPPQHHSGGGGNGGGGRPHNNPPAHQGAIHGVGRNNRPAPKPAPKPRIPGLNAYLNSDAAYRTGTSELTRALQQFKTSNLGSRADVKDAFKTAMERMGEERTKSLQSLQEDFASRGLLTSGLYSDAVSDYNTEYGQRTEDLQKDQRNQLENLQEEFTNFQGLNRSKAADLRLDAIRRRAEKYGIKA